MTVDKPRVIGPAVVSDNPVYSPLDPVELEAINADIAAAVADLYPTDRELAEWLPTGAEHEDGPNKLAWPRPGTKTYDRYMRELNEAVAGLVIREGVIEADEPPDLEVAS